MTRSWKLFTAIITILLLAGASLWLTAVHWLPRLAGLWLPVNTTIQLESNFSWRDGGVWLPAISYRVGDCQLAAVEDLSLKRANGRWQLTAARVDVTSNCLSQLPQNSQPTAPKSVADWQSLLPSARVSVSQLTVTPWQNWAGSLQLDVQPEQQRIDYQGKNIHLAATLHGQRLDISSLVVNAPGLPQPVRVGGSVTLPAIPDALPATGAIHANLTTDSVPHPLLATLDWQQDKGEVRIMAEDTKTLLFRLPWQISPMEISVQQGEWHWPYASQPLSGGINFSLKNWQQGLSSTEMTGRLNALTQGKGGKGNVVLTLGPGHLDWEQSRLPFRLTGDSKMDQMLFFAAIPGEVQGALSAPEMILKPGALLRMRGKLLSTLEVDEARWPLSGLKVSSSGIDGRLQAILTAHDPDTGRFRVHLDGRADNFWPDQGRWQWRYWGDGMLSSFRAKWDVNGRGRWQDKLIELESLSTGFNQISYDSINVHAPRLMLETPLRWQRDTSAPSFSGKLKLKAQQTTFSSGGHLPPAILRLALNGRDPGSFLLQGTLQASPIGPVRLYGRWDGQRLRGQAWWPQQSLTVFQPLLSDDLKMKIQGGTLKAQMAFSAASGQGLATGGHWVVADGSMLMPDNEIKGADFSLPFRFRNNQWYFGARGPVSLRIKEIKNQFALQNITADLQGWYPWSKSHPLRLSNVGMAVLGGKMRMESLQMPQTEAATLRLINISMSELITAIRPKQIAMSGHINAVLPLWLDDSHWLVKEGWIANSGPLTVRLDKDFADAVSANNIAAGAATDWLRYMEISRSYATLNIDNIGQMTLKAQVNGTSRFSDKNQRVSLNYTQQENLFQLWRSLRFADNLQSWVEQNASLPTQKENKNEMH
ncbi:YdbH family protein [Erwinia mallotivora]|uniref:YdbH family protein n=1 Tax=Erwinia mallotivora TaxID=69222 RepID=UPI0035E7CA88